MPATNAYVKFSELPNAPEIANNDQLAVLDVSGGVLCKTPIAHASTAAVYGLGTETQYGHTKVIDAPASTVFNAGQALSASRGKAIMEDVSTINSHLTASNDVPFRFGYNSDTQEYGYIINQGGADTVIPFKTKHTGTYKPTERKVNNDMGEKHEYRYVDTTAVPNYNASTYVAPEYKVNNDMGETNTYRYVDTTQVEQTGTFTATTRGTAVNMGVHNNYRWVNTSGVPNANASTFNATTRETKKDMGETNTYRWLNTTGVPNHNDGTYSFPAGSTGGTHDMGVTNTIQKVNAENVYSKGVSDGKNVNNVSISNPYYGFVSGNASQDRTFTNPYNVSARCYAYNGGYNGVSEIRIYVNETLVADSGDRDNSQSWGGVVGVGGSVRMTHKGAFGSTDKPCEVSLVWAACL